MMKHSQWQADTQENDYGVDNELRLTIDDFGFNRKGIYVPSHSEMQRNILNNQFNDSTPDSYRYQ